MHTREPRFVGLVAWCKATWGEGCFLVMKGDGRAWTWLVVTRRPKPSEQLRWCHTLYVDVDGYRLAERPSSACQTTDLIELYASRRGLTGRSVGSHCVLYTPYLKIRATFIFWITPSPWNIGNSDRQNAEVARSFVWQFKTMNNLYLSSACVGSKITNWIDTNTSRPRPNSY